MPADSSRLRQTIIVIAVPAAVVAIGVGTFLAIEMAARIDDPTTNRPVGVIKGVTQLTHLAHLVAGADDDLDGGVAALRRIVLTSAGSVLVVTLLLERRRRVSRR